MTPMRFEPGAPHLESSTLPLSHCAPSMRCDTGSLIMMQLIMFLYVSGEKIISRVNKEDISV